MSETPTKEISASPRLGGEYSCDRFVLPRPLHTRSRDTYLQPHPFSFVHRLRLRPDPGCSERTLVQPRNLFVSLHPPTDVGDDVAAVGDPSGVSVSHAEPFQQLHLLEQPVYIICFSFWISRSRAQIRSVDRRARALHSALDPRQLRRMAIRISVRDGLPAVAVRHHARKLAEKTNASRMGGIWILVCGEYLCDVVVSLDGVHEVVASSQLSAAGKSPMIIRPGFESVDESKMRTGDRQLNADNCSHAA